MKCGIRTLVVAPDELSRAGLLGMLADSRYRAAPAKAGWNTSFTHSRNNVSLLIIVIGDDAGDAVEVNSRIRAAAQRCKVVVLTDHCDAEFCHDVVCAGAAAYLPRTISSQALVDALDLVLEGELVIPFALAADVFRCSRDSAAVHHAAVVNDATASCFSAALSAREIEIVRRLVHGDSNKRISRALDIAETTVKVHVKTILRKIGATNRTQAAIWGLTHLPDASDRADDGRDAGSMSDVSGLSGAPADAQLQQGCNGQRSNARAPIGRVTPS